ncbi:hypothetical protein BT69DRAFT_1294437 [Atractiella rhizophila]|nr:hypothetical protein BT69DRAFT_1294437 [Atractiella rhizophila]
MAARFTPSANPAGGNKATPQSLATFMGGRLEKAPLHKLKNADEDLEVPVIDWKPKNGAPGPLGGGGGPMGRSLADMIGGQADKARLNKYMVEPTNERGGSAHATSKAPVAMPGMTPPAPITVPTPGMGMSAPAPKSPKMMQTVEKLEGMVEKDDFALSNAGSSGNGRTVGKLGIPSAFTKTPETSTPSPAPSTPFSRPDPEKGGFVRSHVKKMSLEVQSPLPPGPTPRRNSQSQPNQAVSAAPSTIKKAPSFSENVSSPTPTKKPSFSESRPLPSPSVGLAKPPSQNSITDLRSTSPQPLSTTPVTPVPKKMPSFSEARPLPAPAVGLSKPLSSPEPPKGSTFAFVPNTTPAPAFQRQDSTKDDTPSLTRLKGSNIVKQRLGAWGNPPDSPSEKRVMKPTPLKNWEKSASIPKLADIYGEQKEEPKTLLAEPPEKSRNDEEQLWLDEGKGKSPSLGPLESTSGTSLVHLTKGRARGPKRSSAQSSHPKTTTTLAEEPIAVPEEPRPQATNAEPPVPVSNVPVGIKARWGDQAPIGVKQTSAPSRMGDAFKPPVSSVKGVALPGLTASRPLPIPKKTSTDSFTPFTTGRQLPTPSPQPLQPPSPHQLGRPLPSPTPTSRPLPIPTSEQNPLPSDSHIGDLRTRSTFKAATPSPSLSQDIPNRSNVKDAVSSWGKQGSTAPTLPGELMARDDMTAPGGAVLQRQKSKQSFSVQRTVSAQDDATFKVPPIGRLPTTNIQTFYLRRPLPSTDYGTTISTESFAISASTSVPVPHDPATFYESELIAIVHRYKKDTLANTRVFSWQGLRWHDDGKAKKRLGELAARYRATIIPVLQGRESAELLQIIGGRLITRNGDRDHFDPLNSGMYCVRAHLGGVVIDEVPLQAAALSSAASFVICLLSQRTVWHGKAASQAERAAAEQYARSLNGDTLTIVEEGREPPIFWQMLEYEDYASASHWRFNKSRSSPKLFSFASGKPSELDGQSEPSLPRDTVLLYDTGLEIFVVVPPACRGQRLHIATALQAGKDLAMHTQDLRPFKSPVHALVLPSVIPKDLEFVARGIEWSSLNEQQTATKMNLFSLADAEDLLSRNEFSYQECRDVNFLPLGIGPEDLKKAI